MERAGAEHARTGSKETRANYKQAQNEYLKEERYTRKEVRKALIKGGHLDKVGAGTGSPFKPGMPRRTFIGASAVAAAHGAQATAAGFGSAENGARIRGAARGLKESMKSGVKNIGIGERSPDSASVFRGGLMMPVAGFAQAKRRSLGVRTQEVKDAKANLDAAKEDTARARLAHRGNPTAATSAVLGGALAAEAAARSNYRETKTKARNETPFKNSWIDKAVVEQKTRHARATTNSRMLQNQLQETEKILEREKAKKELADQERIKFYTKLRETIATNASLPETERKRLLADPTMRPVMAGSERVPHTLKDTKQSMAQTKDEVTGFLTDPNPDVRQAVLRSPALQKNGDIAKENLAQIIDMAEKDKDGKTSSLAAGVIRIHLKKAVFSKGDISDKMRESGYTEEQIDEFQKKLNE
jgi:hypothetical protein